MNLNTVTPQITYPYYKEALIGPDFSALWADQYALTMGQSFFSSGTHNTLTTFHAFARSMPFDGSYLITGGQNIIFEWLQKYWKFDEVDQYLMRDEYVINPTNGQKERLYTDAYIDYLAKEPLRLTIDAMPEGEIAFPDEPIYRVHGPLIQCALVEAAILNVLNSQSLSATLMSHLVELAEGCPILEFGMRRGMGIGGLEASRGAWLGGASGMVGGGMNGTSNMLAKKFYGIPSVGTMAHAFIMVHDNELDAFANYAKTMPYNGVFLVDTYNTEEGIKKAIDTCKKYGIKLKGIRLDSGDMIELSRMARRLLDEAGFKDTQIIASDGLTYKGILKLKAARAPINTFAMGGYAVNSPDQPSLAPVYKLGAVFGANLTQGDIDVARSAAKKGEVVVLDKAFMRKKIKLSEVAEKASLPGEIDVVRYLIRDKGRLRFDGDTIIPVWSDITVKEGKNGYGPLSRTVISVDKADHTNTEPFAKGTTAYRPLRRFFNEGAMVGKLETVHEGRARAGQRLSMLETSHKGMPRNYAYSTGIEESLYDEKIDMIREIRRTNNSSRWGKKRRQPSVA